MSGPNGAAAKVRVLWVTATLGGGGAEMHTLRVVNALDRSEFAPAVAVARRGGSYERLLAPDVPLFALNGSVRSSTASLALAAPRLRRLIRRYQPDVLCSILDHVNLSTVLSLLGMAERPPLVLCVQITPTYAYDSRRSLMNVAIRLGIRHLYHRADRIVALSRGVADELVERDRRLSRLTEVIPNAGIDDAFLAASMNPAARADVGQTEYLIVACGRLAHQKGFHILLEALAIVRRSVQARLWILGEGPERQQLVEQAKRLGLAAHVSFLGFQAEPARFMAAADVFVLSSLFEGFGNVVVEAMASGVPVVATDCPHGPGEIITDGIDGWLVARGDASALAHGVLRVLRDPAWAAQVARRGRERAAAFHASQIARRYGVMIRELARETGGVTRGHEA